MENNFYQPFDREFLEERQGSDYRTFFQRDRDRIIHSSALRRLQAKTQVFLSGEYDFYRTRLTHSIEVAQIGRSICNHLLYASNDLQDDFFIDPDLVEAICLAHDLGHPPFGHAGEHTLHQVMLPYGGFEGNAQTLRVLTEIIYPNGVHRVGMKPTRALMDGVLKYKTLIGQLENPERYFLYDDQKQYLDFVFDGQAFPAALTPGKKLNKFRSIECQIMDWADDTAYSLNDIIDCVQARFINRERLENWGKSQQLTNLESEKLEAMIGTVSDGKVGRTFSRRIGDFITATHLEKRSNFMSSRTHRYAWQLVVDPAVFQEANLYKRIAANIVFSSAQQQQLIYKWNHILQRLFTAFYDNYWPHNPDCLKLLPEVTHRRVLDISDEAQRIRTICDHLAGMTDRFAIRTYKRLFDPGFGSIGDLI